MAVGMEVWIEPEQAPRYAVRAGLQGPSFKPDGGVLPSMLHTLGAGVKKARPL